jgi:hypothetical protein
MKTRFQILTSIAAVVLSASTVQAAEVDVMKLSGQFGQAPYTASEQGWANATVSVQGNGVNRTAHLFHVSYEYATNTYKYWSGKIPVENVTVKGVSSISVDIDTCEVNYTPSCGYVNFTVATDEPASGWIDNGVRKFQYDGYMRNEVGARQVRASSSTGTVNGLSVDNARAFSGKYEEVTIEVTVGN